MQKYNKKEILIIFIISLLIFILLLFVYFKFVKVIIKNTKFDKLTNTTEKNVKKEFKYKNYIYNIPDSYEYNGNNDVLVISKKGDSWYGNVSLASTKNMLITNINDLFEYNKDKISPTEFKLYTKRINNFDALIYESILKKENIVCFYTKWNTYYRIVLTFENDTFDINKLAPVIESLNNPINLEEALNNNAK